MDALCVIRYACHIHITWFQFKSHASHSFVQHSLLFFILYFPLVITRVFVCVCSMSYFVSSHWLCFYTVHQQQAHMLAQLNSVPLPSPPLSPCLSGLAVGWLEPSHNPPLPLSDSIRLLAPWSLLCSLEPQVKSTASSFHSVVVSPWSTNTPGLIGDHM